MENIQGILDGFVVLLNPSIFIYVLIGFIIGEFFGAMPGLTSALAIALILPITYSMDIVRSLVMCMGVYMAGLYAGSITAITINIPGAPSNVMTAIEGNLLMQKGQGAKALGHAAFASMIGGVIGSILLMLLAPFSMKLALLIRTPGKFSLIFFALVVIILINRKSLAKGAIATFMGIMFGTIGIDLMNPVARFIFGFDVLVEGIDLMAVIIGTFAISEILIQAEKSHEEVVLKIDETRHKFKRSDFSKEMTAYYNEGEQPLSIYSRAIEINPTDADTYYNRGSAYDDKGLYEKAISDYTKVIELKPTNVVAYNNRGVDYIYLGQYDQAISDFNMVIEMDPNYDKAYYNRGNAYLSKGLYDLAISDLTNAIKINPRYDKAYYNRGVAYKKKGLYDSASSDFNKAIEINPRYADAYYDQGNVYFYKRQYEQAISAYTKAIEIDPKDADAYFGKAVACDKAGQPEEAIESYRYFIQYASPWQASYVEHARERMRKLER